MTSVPRAHSPQSFTVDEVRYIQKRDRVPFGSRASSYALMVNWWSYASKIQHRMHTFLVSQLFGLFHRLSASQQIWGSETLRIQIIRQNCFALLHSILELSDTQVYEPYILAFLGTASHVAQPCHTVSCLAKIGFGSRPVWVSRKFSQAWSLYIFSGIFSRVEKLSFFRVYGLSLFSGIYLSFFRVCKLSFSRTISWNIKPVRVRRDRRWAGRWALALHIDVLW